MTGTGAERVTSYRLAPLTDTPIYKMNGLKCKIGIFLQIASLFLYPLAMQHMKS